MDRNLIARLAATLLAIGLAAPAWAQDAESPSDAEAETAAAEAETDTVPADDSDLDEQSYIDVEDDDFRPSEDIPADQSIAFPADI